MSAALWGVESAQEVVPHGCRPEGEAHNGIAVQIGIFRTHSIFVPDIVPHWLPKDLVSVVADTDLPTVKTERRRAEGEGILVSQQRIGHVQDDRQYPYWRDRYSSWQMHPSLWWGPCRRARRFAHSVKRNFGIMF